MVESKGSERLGKRVEAMLRQIDQTIGQLEGVDPTQLHQLQQQQKLVLSTALIWTRTLCFFRLHKYEVGATE